MATWHLLSFLVIATLMQQGSGVLNTFEYAHWFHRLHEGSSIPYPQVACNWILPDAGLLMPNVTVICPTSCLDIIHCNHVKGSGPYAVNSPVCLAAIHAGVIEAHKGGGVEVTVDHAWVPKVKTAFVGTEKNSVRSIDYDSYFASFTVKSADVDCDTHPIPITVPCVDSAILDLVFVADSSLSVTKDFFKLQMNFLRDLVTLFPIGPTKTRVGLITFQSQPTLRFNLDQYSTKSAILGAIEATPWEQGGTYVGKAIRLLENKIKFRKDGSVTKIVLVFTDAQNNDQAEVRRTVKDLHGRGVQVIAIGVGEVDHKKLLQIASNNPHNVYMVESYPALRRYLNSLVSRLCSVLS